MKKYYIFSIVACLLLVIGCGKDKINYGEETPGVESGEYGYLETPSAVLIDMSSENFEEAQSRGATTNETIEEAPDHYNVRIVDQFDYTITYADTYGNFKKEGKMALKQGTYRIIICSAFETPNVDTKANYYTYKDFTIVSEMTTTLNDLVCTMTNIKVTVNYSADIIEMFKKDSGNIEEDLNTEINIEGNIVNFSRDDNGLPYYFKAVKASNTLELKLTGMYNTAASDEEPQYAMIDNWTQTITNVKAGQWRNISISVFHTDEGTVDFSVSIDNWAYDEELNVDTTTPSFQFDITEKELDDTENYITDKGAPVVTQGIDAESLDNEFLVNMNSFTLTSSLETICTKPLILNIEPTEGTSLSEVWMMISSDNDNYNTLLENKFGEKQRENILLSGVISDSYSQTAENTFEATFDKMYQFYAYSGTHKATIMAKDSEGRKSFSYLTIVSSSEDIEEPAPVIAPTIKWRGGNEGSFDEVHTIDPVNGLSVVIDITSETGITGFTLEIISETLTPEELAAINLSSKMDLINPGVHEGGLQFLEFPTGDQVKGQKEMSIDISSFMPMLAAIGAGTSNFVLNVTDDNGTTSKAIQLNVE